MERWADDLDKVFAEAFDAAREALARDDTDSMVQAHLGMLHTYRREFDEAGLRFAEALRLNPNDSRALGLYGLFSGGDWPGRGGDRAVRARRAAESPAARLAQSAQGYRLLSAGRYAEAITASGAAINLERGWLAASCAQAGRLDAARAHLRTFLSVAGEEMAVLPGQTDCGMAILPAPR